MTRAASHTVTTLAALLACVACTGQPSPTRASPTEATSSSVATNGPPVTSWSPTPPVKPDFQTRVIRGDGLTVLPVRKFRVSTSEVAHPGLTEAYIAYPFADDDDTLPNAVGVIDIRSGERQVIARSEWSRGLIDWVEITGSTVVWADQDRIPSTDNRDNKWRLYAYDLTTDRRRLLATSGDSTQPWVPIPRAADGHVVWSELPDGQADPAAGIQLRAWKPNWAQPRNILDKAQVVQATEAISDGQLNFLAPSPGKTGGYFNIDVYTMPLAGGTKRRLSTSGTVEWLDAADGVAVWSERKPPPAEFQDPYTHVVRPLDGSEPARRIQRGYTASNVVVGTGFAAWLPLANGIMVSTFDGRHQTKLFGFSRRTTTRITVFDDLLLFGTPSGGPKVTLHVVKVTPPQ